MSREERGHRRVRSKTGERRDPSLGDERRGPLLMTRREFTRSLIAAGGLMALPLGAMRCAGESGDEADSRQAPRLLFIAFDGLHPDYLELDSTGRRPQPGDGDVRWLMPNLRAFCEQATRFPHARCFLPSATDSNHLNAIAGTSSAQSGVLGVSMQVVNWDEDGTERMWKPHLSWVRDGKGRPVDTLFNSWKRKYPRSRTAFISGKFWIADMFRGTTKNIDKRSDDDPDDLETGYEADIDLFVSGEDPGLSYGLAIPAPTADPNNTFYDPATDADGPCDPESPMQTVLVQAFFQRDPVSFPCDGWVVDAALAVLRDEARRPDLGWILLAQSDDAQHALGTAWDPDEFEKREPGIPPRGLGCVDRNSPDDWQLVSKRNAAVFREAVLDTIRDIDAQFGRLLAGHPGDRRLQGRDDRRVQRPLAGDPSPPA